MSQADSAIVINSKLFQLLSKHSLKYELAKVSAPIYTNKRRAEPPNYPRTEKLTTVNVPYKSNLVTMTFSV